MTVSPGFFNQPTKQLARALLGTYLSHETKGGITIGRIVETEAYLSKNDPACHAHRGKTKRNAVMFGPPGHSYIYLCYGMYYLFNIVSGPIDKGEAVLIRAIEPVSGVQLMQKRRDGAPLKTLANGPGKLVVALGIKPKHNACSLIEGPIKLLPRESFPKLYRENRKYPIVCTTRVGISVGKDLALRFYLRDNLFISKP